MNIEKIIILFVNSILECLGKKIIEDKDSINEELKGKYDDL